ncbi:MAG: hypothetical protein BAJATHORv1_140021, partial [Candidatus Thorarchaeota archaeon]
MTVEAAHIRLAGVAMSRLGAIAVVFRHIVALEAGHTLLQPVDAALDALVLALILVGHAGAVAGHARIANRSDRFDTMAGDQAAKGEAGPADVTLAAGRVTAVAVISEGFLHHRIAEIYASGREHGVVAGQVLVEAGRCVPGSVDVADAADSLRRLQRIPHHALVSGLHIIFVSNPAVAPDAVLRIVDREQEPVLDEDLLPCLQRRQFSPSALAGGLLRHHLLFYRQILQLHPIGVAVDTAAGTVQHRRHVRRRFGGGFWGRRRFPTGTRQRGRELVGTAGLVGLGVDGVVPRVGLRVEALGVDLRIRRPRRHPEQERDSVIAQHVQRRRRLARRLARVADQHHVPVRRDRRQALRAEQLRHAHVDRAGNVARRVVLRRAEADDRRVVLRVAIVQVLVEIRGLDRPRPLTEVSRRRPGHIRRQGAGNIVGPLKLVGLGVDGVVPRVGLRVEALGVDLGVGGPRRHPEQERDSVIAQHVQ